MGKHEQKPCSRNECEQKGAPFGPPGVGGAARLSEARAIIGHQAFQAKTIKHERPWKASSCANALRAGIHQHPATGPLVSSVTDA